MSDREHRLLSFGSFTLDLGRETLSSEGRDVRLRPKSFAVLRHLVEHAGQLVTKEQVMDAVWGKTVVTEGSLTQSIIDIRRALGDQDQRIVRTVARRGFIFELPVQLSPHGGMPETDSPADSPAAARRPEPRAPSRSMRRVVALIVATVAAAVAWWHWSGPVAPSATPSLPPAPPAPAPNTIAVLRFADLSPEGDQAWFADGLAEEILHLLTQSPELRVTARTSSFAVQPDQADIRGIAAQLGVAHVLEGSVRRVGDDLRITAQLIEGGSGSHLWSKAYDRKLNDILEIQREVATDVATALHVSLLASVVPDTPEAARAQELFLLGRHLFHRRSPGDLEAAEGYLEEAVRLDPGHARAWVALAGTYNARGGDELGDPRYRVDDQRLALEQALTLDPGLAEAHLRLARVQRMTDDLAGAERSFRRALEIAPDDPLVLYGQMNRALAEGRLDEALEFERRAVAINPFSAVYRNNFGRSLLGAGQPQEGLAELIRARELGGRQDIAEVIAQALLLLGRVDDARRELAVLPSGPSRDLLLVLLGDTAEARAARSRLEADASFEGLLRRAGVAAYEDRTDQAFAHLDAAVDLIDRGEARERAYQDIYASGLLGRLRDDPRWARLVERLSRARTVSAS